MKKEKTKQNTEQAHSIRKILICVHYIAFFEYLIKNLWLDPAEHVMEMCSSDCNLIRSGNEVLSHNCISVFYHCFINHQLVTLWNEAKWCKNLKKHADFGFTTKVGGFLQRILIVLGFFTLCRLEDVFIRSESSSLIAFSAVKREC